MTNDRKQAKLANRINKLNELIRASTDEKERFHLKIKLAHAIYAKLEADFDAKR